MFVRVQLSYGKEIVGSITHPNSAHEAFEEPTTPKLTRRARLRVRRTRLVQLSITPTGDVWVLKLLPISPEESGTAPHHPLPSLARLARAAGPLTAVVLLALMALRLALANPDRHAPAKGPPPDPTRAYRPLSSAGIFAALC